jgi:hypothetical protein
MESEAELYDFDLTRFLHADRHSSSGRSRGHASRKSGSQTFRTRALARTPLFTAAFAVNILRIRTIVEVSRLSERAGRGFNSRRHGGTSRSVLMSVVLRSIARQGLPETFIVSNVKAAAGPLLHVPAQRSSGLRTPDPSRAKRPST